MGRIFIIGYGMGTPMKGSIDRMHEVQRHKNKFQEKY